MYISVFGHICGGSTSGREHESWSSWVEYLAKYQQQSKQAIKMQEVVCCANRNHRLSTIKAAQSGKGVCLVPMEWDVCQRAYICTHG